MTVDQAAVTFAIANVPSCVEHKDAPDKPGLYMQTRSSDYFE